MSEPVGGQGSHTKHRELHGPARVAHVILLVGAPVIGILYVLNVHFYLGFTTLWREQYIGFFLSCLLADSFLTVAPTQRAISNRVPWYDLVAACAGFAVGGYIAILYPKLLLAGLQVTPQSAVLGGVLILLALEVTRRVFGWIIVGIACFFIFYAAYTHLFPGDFYGIGTPWPALLTHIYLSPTSFMYIVGIIATLALAFILFSQALFRFGGADVLTKLALGLMGRYRGGPAKVAVVASSLFGTISGSTLSNILVTGSVTIPLMKQTGYRPHVAAAVEAVASNGGMLMPPVMGITAFIMAELTGVPYYKVALIAFIPAVLYYIALFIQVDMEAAKQGLMGLPRQELPRLMPVLRRGWAILLPLLFIIYTLFVMRLPPATAAAYATGFALIVLLLLKENRVQFWRRFLSVFEEAGRVLYNVGAVIVPAGFVLASVEISGLAFKISMFLVAVGQDNILLLLVIAAVGAIVLGMGLPGPVCYILVAVLLVPAVIEMGMPLLASHLFILYYANLAPITPPIASGAFVAAALARADPMATGWYAMRLGILAYVVPFLFIFNPALLLQGPAWEIVVEVITAILGTIALGVTLSGHLFKSVPWFRRLLVGLGALALLVSIAVELMPLGLILKLAGGMLTTCVFLWEWKHRIG